MSPISKLSITSTIRLATGYDMPMIGFGVYQNYNASVSTLEAFRAGYRLIDTAQVYRNEKDVGQAVRESGIERSQVFVVTKCVSKTHGYESTKKGIEESLKVLGIGYIDLFLIHDPFSGKERRLETYKALLEGKSEGKIRSVGVSNFNIKHIEELREAGYELPAVNQIELHPFCQQKPIVKYCRENNIVVQAYCPIVRGKMDHPVINELATKYSRDPAQILIRWSMQHGYVPLPKSEKTERILSNIDVFGFELDETDMHALDGLDRGKEGAVSWNPVDVD
ncbi:Glyoxal reductase [Psilocybe cubensis]|uniref:Glyoxal reductase n=2 Tax=Psilocybe cubensis TaxID=181762 RepID=A0ACB8HBD1_PSICU|nr:Glyoxal reductase [Psilocybe cubensis]KAH9485098.1 Glyoxal reductase [Psilocybe cubensis]